MGILDRLLGRSSPPEFDAKAADLPFVSAWIKTTFAEPTFRRLTDDGYNKNGAVFQCVSALAFAYPEPPPRVLNAEGEHQESHPLQRLLDRPNPLMSHAELRVIDITYRAIGGNTYLHKVRGRGGQVVELWPYHAGQMRPIPSASGWVEDYEYDIGDGNKRRIPGTEIIHLKWPAVDLSQPWVAAAPLRSVAQEVDTDTELTRYLYALLRNDATARGVVTLPSGVSLSPTQADKLKAQFYRDHGGMNRGGVQVLEQGATYQRISLNLQEMAFEALRRVPESRIAGAFRIPAIVAGLYVGIEKSIYNNYREAVSQFTEGTLVPLWKSDAAELTQALANEFSGNTLIDYDFSKVAALQENEDAKYARVLNAYDKDAITKNEARVYLGYPRVGDLPRLDEGDMFKAETATPAPAPRIIDAIVEPALLTDEQKRYPFPISLKLKRDDTTRTIEEQMRDEVAAYLKAHYEAAV